MQGSRLSLHGSRVSLLVSKVSFQDCRVSIYGSRMSFHGPRMRQKDFRMSRHGSRESLNWSRVSIKARGWIAASTIKYRYQGACAIEITEVRHVSCFRYGIGVGTDAASHPDPTIFRSWGMYYRIYFLALKWKWFLPLYSTNRRSETAAKNQQSWRVLPNCH
jgi:hypothetical protein